MYLLQSVVQLHGSEQEALLAPQGGADLLTHSSQLDALGPDGVLGIVGVFYQPVTFTGQGQCVVQCVLQKHMVRIYFRIQGQHRWTINLSQPSHVLQAEWSVHYLLPHGGGHLL